MRIIGVDNQMVEMKIAGYEMPGCNDYEDGNWLEVTFDIKSKFGNWSVTDSCLTTEELIEIRDWLQQMATSGAPLFDDLMFLEPCLSFEFIGNDNGDAKFRIIFEGELRPMNANGQEEISIEVVVNEEGLRRLVEELDVMIGKFPVVSG